MDYSLFDRRLVFARARGTGLFSLPGEKVAQSAE
jgi:hypothetical protein